MIKHYWSRHQIADPLIAGLIAAGLWCAPMWGVEPLFKSDPATLPDILSKWLAGCLTFIGLIIATTGFLTSLLQTADFAPLAKSASVAQLWEILRQNLGWLFLACIFSVTGSFSHFEQTEFLVFSIVGTFILLTVIITLAKLVWVIRSVLFVKISQARRS